MSAKGCFPAESPSSTNPIPLCSLLVEPGENILAMREARVEPRDIALSQIGRIKDPELLEKVRNTFSFRGWEVLEFLDMFERS